MIAFESNDDGRQEEDFLWDEDTERMIRVSTGDRDAFDELIRRHFRSTVRIVASMLGTHESAEDLAQEIFLRIYRARRRYVPKAQFSTWLGTIIRNTVLNAKRGQSRCRLRFLGVFDESSQGYLELRSPLGPPNQTEASQVLESRETVTAVSEAIDELPARQRRAVQLVHLGGMSYAGAAAEMNTSPKAVKSLLGRGRVKLASSLREEYQRRFPLGE